MKDVLQFHRTYAMMMKFLKPLSTPVMASCMAIFSHSSLAAEDGGAKSSLAPEKGSPVELVNPLVDTHKSRWFYFSPASRPFGMVNLAPNTKLGQPWMSGYLYNDKNIQCFSHIHAWQMSGIPVMPVNGEMIAQKGLAATASPFSHEKEEVHPGYYKVELARYGITAELTSTMRVGFHRYTFPKNENSAITLNTGATLMHPMDTSAVRQVSDTEIAGYSVMSRTARRHKPFKVYFVARFSKPVTFGAWQGGKLLPAGTKQAAGGNSGCYAGFSTEEGEQVLMKVALSYTSEENARKNLEAELPEWDFDATVRASYAEWNQWMGKIAVEGGSENQRIKFYTDLWHSLQGRRTVSDVDGSYADNTGAKTVVRQVPLDKDGKPKFPHHNFDGFWGSHWSLDILWTFAYPEAMDRMCNSMLNMYHDGGLIPRGPSGGNYTYVMVGDTSVPLIAAAYLNGIRNYDVEKIYEGLMKNAMPGGIRDHAGYESRKGANSGGMKYYVERGYVPEGINANVRDSGGHKNGAAMTLEYAYQDWCLANMAKAMGKEEDAAMLMKRSQNFRNVWDPTVNYIRPRMMDGTWMKNFTPVAASNNAFNAPGFTESNSAIYSHYVPQDTAGIIKLHGGNEVYVKRLEEQFKKAEPSRFVAPHAQHGAAWVDYENQPCTHLAHMFNHAGYPWLTQKWVRKVYEKTFSGVTPFDGYLGDEDQGQMGALSALMAIGLFDTQGVCDIDSTYEITSPLFDKITINLDSRYFPGKQFVITTKNNTPENIYIQSATLNGKPLNTFHLPHKTLVNGGTLEIVLGPEPNKEWGNGK